MRLLPVATGLCILLLAECGSQGSEDAGWRTDGPARIEVGGRADVAIFRSLPEEGATLPLETNGQGFFHLWVGVRAHNIDPYTPMLAEYRITDLETSWKLAEMQVELTDRLLSIEDGHWIRIERVILTRLAEEVDGHEAEINVSISQGETSWRDSARVKLELP